MLGLLLRAHGTIDDGIESFYSYIRNSGAYRQHVSETEFAETWAQASDIVASNQKRRDRLSEARARILKDWVTPRAASWVNRQEHTPNFLASVQQLAMTMAFEDAVPHMNCAILGRFVTPARGVAKIPGATSGDVIKIRNGGV